MAGVSLSEQRPQRRVVEVLVFVLVGAVILYFVVISPLLIRTGHQRDPCGGGAGDPNSPYFDPNCGPPNLQDNP
jgi:hypothetical protein